MRREIRRRRRRRQGSRDAIRDGRKRKGRNGRGGWEPVEEGSSSAPGRRRYRGRVSRTEEAVLDGTTVLAAFEGRGRSMSREVSRELKPEPSPDETDGDEGGGVSGGTVGSSTCESWSSRRRGRGIGSPACDGRRGRTKRGEAEAAKKEGERKVRIVGEKEEEKGRRTLATGVNNASFLLDRLSPQPLASGDFGREARTLTEHPRRRLGRREAETRSELRRWKTTKHRYATILRRRTWRRGDARDAEVGRVSAGGEGVGRRFVGGEAVLLRRAGRG